MAEAPRRRNIAGTTQYRIVPSIFPPVALFETLVSADELEVLYAIESLTNDRLNAQAGNLYLVPKGEWVTGPGASVVMAAFTHIGRASRFSAGTYGVYYAGRDLDTAIAETVFHSERRLRDTDEAAIELDMRCYVGTVETALEDIRGRRFAHLQDPDLATWPVCQAFGSRRRDAGAFGLLYRSARHKDGECVAAFRPRAVSLPAQGQHFRYCWNGERIDRVMTVSRIREL
ncbi:MAG TPA: RES family NAD+ phosphorylase [Woeseiaceae bacterium]